MRYAGSFTLGGSARYARYAGYGSGYIYPCILYVSIAAAVPISFFIRYPFRSHADSAAAVLPARTLSPTSMKSYTSFWARQWCGPSTVSPALTTRSSIIGPSSISFFITFFPPTISHCIIFISAGRT